jgi:flagellar motor switch protein FliM
MPYAMIEPIRDILYSSLQGDHMEADKRWVRLLSRQIQSAEVEIVANLGEANLTLNQVSSLKAGDVIPLDIPAELTAQVGGVPVMECNYGVFNGQYALRVVRMIDHSMNDRSSSPHDA